MQCIEEAEGAAANHKTSQKHKLFRQMFIMFDYYWLLDLPLLFDVHCYLEAVTYKKEEHVEIFGLRNNKFEMSGARKPL